MHTNILSTLLHLLPMTCQPEGNTYRFEIRYLLTRLRISERTYRIKYKVVM